MLVKFITDCRGYDRFSTFNTNCFRYNSLLVRSICFKKSMFKIENLLTPSATPLRRYAATPLRRVGFRNIGLLYLKFLVEITLLKLKAEVVMLYL